MKRRLVDYVVVCGLTEGALLDGAGAAEGGGRGQDGRHADPIFRNFRAQTLWRYPPADHADYKYQDAVPDFCFPTFIQLKQVTRKDGTPQPTHHAFTLTDEAGTKIYGVALVVNELMDHGLEQRLRSKYKYGVPEPEIQHFISVIQTKIDELSQSVAAAEHEIARLDPGADAEHIAALQDNVRECSDTIALHSHVLAEYRKELERNRLAMYLPKAVCIISHWPFFDFFKDYLSQLVWASQQGLLLPLERYIVNITSEVPLPPPGKTEVAVTIDHTVLYLSRPPLNDLPALKNFSYYWLFRFLTIENIVLLVEALLSERRIYFHCKQLALLTLAAETVASLLYPFVWHLVWIPCFPAELARSMNPFEAIVPIVAGVPSLLMSTLGEADVSLPAPVMVDLDACNVTTTEPIQPLPADDRKKLIEHLHRYGNVSRAQKSSIPPSIFQPIPLTGEPELGSCKSALPNVSAPVPYAMHHSIPKPWTRGGIVSPRSVTREGEPARNSATPTKMGGDMLMDVSSSSSSSRRTTPPLPTTTASPNESLPSSPSLQPAVHAERKKKHREGLYVDMPAGATGETVEHIDTEVFRALPRDVQEDIARDLNITLDELLNRLELQDNMQLASEGGLRKTSQIERGTKARSVSASQLAEQAQAAVDVHEGSITSSDNALRKRAVTLMIKNTMFGPSRRFVTRTAAEATATAPQQPMTAPAREKPIVRLQNTASAVSAPTLMLPSSDTRRSGDIASLLNKGDSPVTPKHAGFYVQVTDEPGVAEHGRSSPATAQPGSATNLAPENMQPLTGPPLLKSDLADAQMWNERMIRDSFLRLFASLFRDYRRFLNTTEQRHDQNDAVMQCDAFVHSVRKDRKVFMQHFLQKQMAMQFFEERYERTENDSEILYFDECIRVKKNRSVKWPTPKEPTPFISDQQTYKLTARHVAMEPNRESTPHDAKYVYERFPETWNAAHALPPRECPPLVTSDEEIKLKLHTNALARQARLQKQKGRLEVKLTSPGGRREIVLPRLLPPEERARMLDVRLEKVHREIQKWSIPRDDLDKKTVAYVEVVIKILLTQQEMLMNSANDDELVTSKTHERELPQMLQQIAEQITIYEEHLRLRGSNV